MKKLLALTALILPIAMTEAKSDLDPENTLLIDLKDGQLVIQMFPEDAPGHVGFMAQTGDVQFGNVKKFNEGRVGTGGADKPDLKAEFNKRKHGRGACSMARSSNPNSANSQFFICFKSANFLDGQYTVWGQVVEGTEHVDKIKRGVPGSGSVSNPDHMKKVSVAADAKKKGSSDAKGEKAGGKK